MNEPSLQLDIPFETIEPSAGTSAGVNQTLDRMRQRREDAIIAAGLPVSVNQRAKLTRQPGISALNFDHPG